MSKFIYIIFFFPLAQLYAMESAKVSSDYKKATGNKIIAVANILKHGVTAQLYNAPMTNQANEGEKKVWVRSVSMGRIETSPPQSPTISHLLVIRGSDDAEVLVRTTFLHPKEDTIYAVRQEKEGVTVREVTAEDLTSCGPQPAASKINFDIMKKHVQWQDEQPCADLPN